MMFKKIRDFFKPSEDKILANKNAFYLADKIIELQNTVKKLEESNKCLQIEMEQLQAKVNKIQPVVYNIMSEEKLSHYTLGEK